MKTHKSIRKNVCNALGGGNIIHHEPSEENPLGQSGAHTFIDDIVDIVLNAQDEADAYKQLIVYLMPARKDK